MQKNCFCGQPNQFLECCGAIHSGNRVASTAEELMRSRYSAFATANVDYILATYSEETRPVDQKKEIGEWAESVEWLGLEIINVEKGNQHDEEGFVEFKAKYRENGVNQVLHEKSYFRKENENWVYVSREYPKTETKPKLPGRNEPCFCGSGKKYKKCCSAKR